MAILGALFYVHSVALFEDLDGVELEFPEDALTLMEDEVARNEYFDVVDAEYERIAINCWIAALLYVITMVFSAFQFFDSMEEVEED